MIQRNNLILLFAATMLIMACGPDTIFLRPALDTPQQHVKNGHNLLDRGKVESAREEFLRAKALDEKYAPAYVGVALVQARQGDVEGGLATLERAKSLTATAEEREAVARCFKELKGMQNRN
jgi:tetratricopeptide (TPR) repeat protein